MNTQATWTMRASSICNRALHAYWRIQGCGQINLAARIKRVYEVDHWLAQRYERNKKAA